MTNPVISETGDFALSVPVTLQHYGGATSEVRGVIGRLKQSPGDLEGSFSDSDWCCWCTKPANQTRVEYLTANGQRWRVLDTEDEIGAAFASIGYGSVRYMLVDAPSEDIPETPLMPPITTGPAFTSGFTRGFDRS